MLSSSYFQLSTQHSALPLPPFVKTVRWALQLPGFDPTAAQTLMAPLGRPPARPPDQPGQARQGAVLLLLYPKAADWYIVFGKRPSHLRHHPGQVAFPGGRCEAGESYETAALRETHEELGVPPATIHLLGPLTPIYIPPSDFEVHPYVGWTAAPPLFLPAPDEVEEVVEMPLAHLADSRNRIVGEWQYPFFRFGEHRIWGGTAVILNEFRERLAQSEELTPSELLPPPNLAK